MATTNKAIDKDYLLTQLKNFESVILSKKYGTASDLTTVLNAVAILNSSASTTGSVAYTAAEAVAKIVANAPEDFDTLKEIADWIAEHPEDTTAMNTAIKNLQTLVGTIPEGATATTVTGYVEELVDATQGEVDTLSEKIDNIELTAEKVEYDDTSTSLGSKTVQGAIEKLDSRLDETDTSISSINTHLTSTDTNLTKLNNKTRRTRNNITSNLGNLAKAAAEQDLEKYGYSIGDYFTGASGYTYHLADMDTYYGGYNNNAVVSTHHIGIVVDTKASSAWLSSGTASSYSASTLHTYLKGTALTNIKNDFTTLFGSSSHLLAHTELDNGPSGWGTTWTGLANTQICALSEVQVYGSRIFGMDGYQSGTACRCLEIFRKFRFNEILGNKWWWLRSLSSSSYACDANFSGHADNCGLSDSGGVVGLILFY